MADISKITLPNGSSYSTYDISDTTARSKISSSASISETGLITYKNSDGTVLFTLQLPLYAGGSF